MRVVRRSAAVGPVDSVKSVEWVEALEADSAAPVKTEDYTLRATNEQEQLYVLLYETLVPQLVDLAARYLGRAAARDAVQDVMTRLWFRWDGVAARRPPVEYFFGAVLKEVAAVLRRETAHEARLKRFLYRLARRSQRDTDPEEVLAVTELETLIGRKVAALPARCRAAWALVHENGFTYEQAAVALGLTPATVRGHVARAIGRLRDAALEAGYDVQSRGHTRVESGDGSGEASSGPASRLPTSTPTTLKRLPGASATPLIPLHPQHPLHPTVHPIAPPSAPMLPPKAATEEDAHG